MGWDPFEEIKKTVENIVPGGGSMVMPGIADLFAPGTSPIVKGFQDLNQNGNLNFQFDGWDNPFSNLAKELSGQNGGLFNPFNLGAELGDKNAMEWRDKWSSGQGWMTRTVHSNVDNVVGEVSGSNKQRQEDWENKVKQDAQAAQDKYLKDELEMKQRKDLLGSRAAARGRSAGSRTGGNLNWAANGADVTDFLGL